jgi:hypothetical protein
VQPNGSVIVPFTTATGKQAVFKSTDGGASWRHAKTIAKIAFAPVRGSLRTSPLPTAEIDGAGNVYVAWQDCRFRVKCSSNDIVFSSSADGLSWSAVKRVPIDPVTSGADHFVPGLAVDKATTGTRAHLALTYYFYPDATCAGGCQLDTGYISSPDGGKHWGNALQLAGPAALNNIAKTTDGRVLGDYISTSFNQHGAATTVFPVGIPATGAQAFDEAMFAPRSPLAVTPLAAAHNVARSTSGASKEASRAFPIRPTNSRLSQHGISTVADLLAKRRGALSAGQIRSRHERQLLVVAPQSRSAPRSRRRAPTAPRRPPGGSRRPDQTDHRRSGVASSHPRALPVPPARAARSGTARPIVRLVGADGDWAT